MGWVIGKQVALIGIGFVFMVVATLPQGVEAKSGGASWLGESLEVVSQLPPGVADADRCLQRWLRIEVESIGSTYACVSGDWGGVRVGWYSGYKAVRYYVIAYPYVQTFSRLYGACGTTAECTYSQKNDVFIAGTNLPGKGQVHAFITHFSKKLTRPSSDPKSYLFSGIENETFVSLAPGVTPTSNSLVMSPNGEWALLELHAYGFIRVNLQTLQYKRVYPTGARYGVGNDPAFELAISNDGTRIAVADWKAGVKILEITPECGELLSLLSPNYGFAVPEAACPVVTENLMSIVPGMYHAVFLNFSNDGRWLSLYNFSAPEPYKLIVAPHADRFRQTNGYVAFGDSFSSGEGEVSDQHYIAGTNTADNTCHVSDRSYPYLLGVRWSMATTNHACSGSVLNQVWRASGDYFVHNTQESMPSVISVGVGGNDIGLMGKLKTCLSPGTCEWAKPAARISSAQEIRQFLPRLSAYLQDVKRTFPNSKIMVVGYPDVVNVTTHAPCDAVVGALLDDTERKYLAESVSYLNKVLELAARRSHVAFADVSQAYGTARLCDDTPLAMNALRFGDDIAPVSFLDSFKVIGSESFHPTPIGHDMVARVISAQFMNPGSVEPCENCSQSDSFIEPGEYWNEGSVTEGQQDNSLKIQLKESFLASGQLVKGHDVTVHFAEGSFKPSSSVRIELHSDPMVLAEVTAHDDGSLNTSVTIPTTHTGYHTVHVYGTSQSDEQLDLYDFLTLVDEPAVPKPVGVIEVNPLPMGTLYSTHQAASAPSPFLVSASNQTVPSVPTAGQAQVLGAIQTPAIKSPQQAPPKRLQYNSLVVIVCAGLVVMLVVLSLWYYKRHKSIKTMR